MEGKSGVPLKSNTAKMCIHAELVNTDEPQSTVSEWTHLCLMSTTPQFFLKGFYTKMICNVIIVQFKS